MNINDVPEVVERILDGAVYLRHDHAAVDYALNNLGASHDLLAKFFRRYEGPFWSEYLGCEMMDMVEGGETVTSMTEGCRRMFGFPASIIVLTKISAGQVVVLNQSDDKVFEVDFEGGDALLRQGKLRPRWNSFRCFLEEYFSGVNLEAVHRC